MINTIKIDRAALSQQIRSNAEQYLTEINQANLELFLEETMSDAKNVFAQFVSETFQYWSSHITDQDALLRFTDLTDGYRNQMYNWEKENVLSADSCKSQCATPKQEAEQGGNAKKMGVGSLVVGTGLALIMGSVTGSKLVGAAVELITLGASYTTYKNIKKKEDDFARESARVEMEIARHKFIDCVASSIEEWIDSAEQKSDSLLKSFNCI